MLAGNTSTSLKAHSEIDLMHCDIPPCLPGSVIYIEWLVGVSLKRGNTLWLRLYRVDGGYRTLLSSGVVVADAYGRTDHLRLTAIDPSPRLMYVLTAQKTGRGFVTCTAKFPKWVTFAL